MMDTISECVVCGKFGNVESKEIITKRKRMFWPMRGEIETERTLVTRYACSCGNKWAYSKRTS